ncbi:DUF6434 domain-containing protein [Flammeovirga sp. OC4]|uniref:DUF6434 domain-containing protein n=1 Tax=Flammeovirga sp. OC4 TaxID=1382345 RepID=UPI0005C4DB3E|nr:DUF6434 domain-containing protein [Flammeovirga sp. OC4]
MDKRPILNKDISKNDFQEFYWLKEELVDFCRSEGLLTTGGKIEISGRIEKYIKTGEKHLKSSPNKVKVESKFDWNNEKLTLETKITDNYKNTENVREFFKNEIGSQFKFNVRFMNWMKSNAGKTLADSISEWKKIKTESKSNQKAKEIAPQFEYNKYLRDFLADNPTLNRDLGIKLWKLKKTMRGSNKYEREDLEFLK